MTLSEGNSLASTVVGLTPEKTETNIVKLVDRTLNNNKKGKITVPYDMKYIFYWTYSNSNNISITTNLSYYMSIQGTVNNLLSDVNNKIVNLKWLINDNYIQRIKLDRRNDFAYSAFDKAYFVITIDDANQYLGGMYDLCHELQIPLCPAIIPSNLNRDWNSEGRTIKDICDAIVADGGEILSHSGKYIKNNSTESDYYDVFVQTKQDLENAGYNIRGIITAGGAGYLSNNLKLDNWSRKYYDYSDQNGITSSKAYWKPRWWPHDYTMADAKTYVDNAIQNKSFVVIAMHGTDNTSDLEYIDNVRELLEYMLSKGTNNLQITTWANVYDNFKSLILEERIKRIENNT